MRAQVSLELIVVLSGMIVIATAAYFFFKGIIGEKEADRLNESTSNIIDTIKNWSGQNTT
jgi:uncharacterized protein (UPF0333 family)